MTAFKKWREDATARARAKMGVTDSTGAGNK
jgi:hypothetical protein